MLTWHLTPAGAESRKPGGAPPRAISSRCDEADGPPRRPAGPSGRLDRGRGDEVRGAGGPVGPVGPVGRRDRPSGPPVSQGHLRADVPRLLARVAADALAARVRGDRGPGAVGAAVFAHAAALPAHRGAAGGPRAAAGRVRRPGPGPGRGVRRAAAVVRRDRGAGAARGPDRGRGPAAVLAAGAADGAGPGDAVGAAGELAGAERVPPGRRCGGDGAGAGRRARPDDPAPGQRDDGDRARLPAGPAVAVRAGAGNSRGAPGRCGAAGTAPRGPRERARS